jgi:hypothetical protein
MGVTILDGLVGGECGERAMKRTVVDGGMVKLTESLQMKRDQLAKQLTEIDEAIAGLAAHPEVETVLNQLAKVNRY